MKQHFYYFILSVAFLFVSLRSGAATNNEVEKLLAKAKQELYSNPRQSAYCSSKVQEIAFSDDQRVRAFLLYAQAEEMLGDFDGCLQALFKADRLISKTDTQLRGALYNQMSGSYCLLGDYTKAIELSDLAISLFKTENDSVSLAQAYNSRGIIHSHLDEYVQADRFFMQALEINRKYKNLKKIAANLNNLCLYPGDLPTQIRWISEAIVINRNLNATWSLSENYNNLGRLYYYQKKYVQAVIVLNKAYQLASGISAKGLICDNYEYLSWVYAATGEFKKAYEKQVALYALNKEIQNVTKLRNVEQNVARERLEYQHQENLRKEQEYEIAQLRRNIVLVLVVACSLAIIGWLLHQRVKRKKKLQLINTQYRLEQSEHEVAKLKVHQQEMELLHVQSALENNKQEMTNFAVFLQSRNELLDKIRELIRQGYKMEGSELLTHLKKINAFISQHQSGDKTGSLTLRHIDEKNQEFIERLVERHPGLTQGERHLATLLRVELSTKEIAMLSGTTPKTINMNRYRLRKSLGLSSEDDLVEYIRSI